MKIRIRAASSGNKRATVVLKEPQPPQLFPIVGIGASVDGLAMEAREENARLKRLPASGG